MFKKMFENKRNIVVFSVLGAILILGITYALINWTSNDYNIAIRSACMNINYVNGQDIDTNITAIDESQYINGNTLTVSPDMVFSTVSIELDDACSDVEGFATLEINVSDLSNQLKSGGKFGGSLRYTIVEYDPSDYVNLNMTKLVGDTFPILNSGEIVNNGVNEIYYEHLRHGETHNYLIFFYADNTLFGNNMLDLTFDGTISAKVEQFISSLKDYTYSISGQDIILTKYNGTSSNVFIPSDYILNGIKYNTVVANSLFSANKYIETVYFSDNVLSLDGDASYLFINCSKLRKVVGFLKSVTNMTQTFYGCYNLEVAPAIPDSVTKMDSTFGLCRSLVNAPTIPDSVTSMYSTFSDCISLVNAPIIPDSVTTLTFAFYNCKKLVNAPTIPNSVTLMDNTFNGCENLVNAPTIPDSVTSMYGLFYNCKKLVNAPIIGNSVVNMNDAFSGCISLVNAPTIPDSVTRMDNTFKGCVNLVNAPTIPDSVTSMIGTFSSCNRLVNVPIIGNSVTNMTDTFLNCNSLVYGSDIPSSVVDMTGTFYGCDKLTGTIRIKSSNVIVTSGTGWTIRHPFFRQSYGSSSITVEVPAGSKTYDSLINDKPSKVTIVQY